AVYMGPYGEAAVFSRQGSGGGGVVVGLLDNENLGGWGALQNEVVCESSARNGELIARGFRDGTVRLGSVEFSTKLFAAGSDTDGGIGYSQEIEGGRIRRVSVEESFGEPLKLKGGEGAVLLVDYQVDTTGKTVLAALRADLTVVVSSVRTIRPLGGGAAKTRLKATSFLLNGDEVPVGLKVSADGGQVFVVYRDGGMDRFAREKRDFVFRERVETLSTQRDDGGEVSVVEMVIGGQTVLIGDTFGGVQSWHVALDEQDRFGDGRFLVRSHLFGRVGDGVGVVDLTPSGRDRTVGVLYSDGVVVLRHLTSEKTIVRIESGVEGAVLVAIGPKNDAVLVAGEGGYGVYGYEAGYAEFSIKALFGKVVYEGLPAPAYVYQSSSGDDSSEVKLSVMPLVFGTLKATVFAMLFAIPVAVFAALYSSEFLSRRVRKVVKPSVELMASLPSVVLGFVAAMVVAPYVAEYLGSFLVGMFVLPFGVLFGAHVWQLVPLSTRLRFRTGHHLMMVAGVLFLSGVLAWGVGPTVVGVGFAPDEFDRAMMSGGVVAVDGERVPEWSVGRLHETRVGRRLRAMEMGIIDTGGGGVVVERDMRIADDGKGFVDADLRRWLNGEYGSATPGWVMACMPLAVIGVWIVQAFTIRRRIDVWLSTQNSATVGMVVLGKFVVLAMASLAVAYVAAAGLTAAGVDPRDSVFGTFSPRNTLVVAVIMGFAVIPIIFTISEDALRAVPDSLRSASLGAGATKWQTAVRIVLPVAGSGIFSACMIGFGRAVGETMIVLMATGNTPEMSWNIFAGFRTLAANIAVELPEAPKGGTHYRVLFLCGFVLFVMTFVINTSAEVVRQVVRKRNAGL
ncbi:MAG: ABC transporter permease subunit, partial [Phycisphaerales bacterium]|nr:ABC transporter permease subunit [Phycisphaerales bacterium]